MANPLFSRLLRAAQDAIPRFTTPITPTFYARVSRSQPTALNPKTMTFNLVGRRLFSSQIPRSIEAVSPPSTNSSSSNNILRMLGGTIMVSGGIILNEVINNDLNPMSSQPIKNSDDLKLIHEEMLHELLLNVDLEETTRQITSLSPAINYAITRGNRDTFKYTLKELININPQINNRYFALLINTCAAQGRVSLLHILNDQFDLSALIAKNKLAMKLLQHPAKNEIERLSSQFILGVGNIKHEGSHLQLALQKDLDLQHAETKLEMPLTTGLDVVDDLVELKSFAQLQQHAQQKIETAYHSVVVLESSSDKFEHYLDVLKHLSASGAPNINSVYLVYGGHFTTGQIQIVRQENGALKVKYLHIDSSGSSAGFHSQESFIPGFEVRFPQQVDYIVAELKVQHANKGCSVFSLMNVHDLIYHHNIFNYLARYTTDSQTRSCFSMDSTQFNFTFKTALLPLAFSRGKQSMSNHGKVSVYEPPANPNENVTFSDKIVLGYKGLLHEIEDSPNERKNELHFPISAYTSQTVAEWLEINVKINAQGKHQNKTTERMIFQWGLQLVPWLVSLKPEEIIEKSQSFDLQHFMARHGLRNNFVLPPCPSLASAKIREETEQKKTIAPN